jgi:hypothetical protein
LKTFCVNLAASNNPPCFLVSNSNNSNEIHAIFLRDGWRKRLCRCIDCCVRLIILFDSLLFSDLSLIRNYMIIPILPLYLMMMMQYKNMKNKH